MLWGQGVSTPPQLPQSGWNRAVMHKTLVSRALRLIPTATISALAVPPADLDACLKLTSETVKAAKVDTEADYVKFYFEKLDLDAACGSRDFAAAERIANEIQATFKAK